MQIKTFIVIGENIHCTRVLKRGGNLVDDRGLHHPLRR